MDERRRRIAETRMLKIAEVIMQSRFDRHRDDKVSSLIERVAAREINPHTGAMHLIAEMQGEN